MSKKSTKKKTHDHYYVGEYIWRITDNALFEITNVTLDNREDGSNGISSYDLTCVNHAPVEDVTVYLEMVHDTGSIYTRYTPPKPVKGQHVWNTSIDPVCNDKYRHDYYHDKCENEFIVEDVVEKKPETIITLMNLSGHKKQTITLEQFNASYTMLPPYYDEIDKFVKSEMKSIRDASLGTDDQSETEAEAVVNDQIEKEAVDTGIEDYYEIWKKSLKVVNVPKFDLNYFTKGLAYHVNKVTSNYPGEFYGIMVEATENLLRVMKLGTHIHIESTEIIEIPLKEYLNGDWHIVRLVEEV